MTTKTSLITVRNEVAKVMFLQASVCPHGGVCLSACWNTTHPPGEQTPPEQTPPTPREQTPLGVDIPLLVGADPPPGADTPREQTHPPRSRHTPPQEQTPPPRSRHPPPGPERRPLLRTVRILLECILVFYFSPFSSASGNRAWNQNILHTDPYNKLLQTEASMKRLRFV